MKHFQNVLQEIIEANQQTQAEIGKRSGLGQLKISRLVNGVIRADKEDLLALFKALKHDNQKADLAFAHIKDEVPPETFEYLDITVRSQSPGEALPASSYALSSKQREAMLHILGVIEKKPDVGNLLVYFAKVGGWKEQPSHKTTKKPRK